MTQAPVRTPALSHEDAPVGQHQNQVRVGRRRHQLDRDPDEVVEQPRRPLEVGLLGMLRPVEDFS